MPSSNATPRPVMLCILDGWGLSSREEANAVALAATPNFDSLWNNYPHTQLSASGTDVGLPAGVMGNSEVGHLNIGAGRIVWQDSSLIDHSIREGSFFANEALLAAIHHARDHGRKLHLMGLISNGNVHSSEGHYCALLEMAAREGLAADQVLVHAFTDGRDTPPRSAHEFIAQLLGHMVKTGVGVVASVIGRYYAMDRDNRWERVRAAYDCLTEATGHQAADALEAVRAAYARGENDEFIEATVVLDAKGKPRPRITDEDAVIFFNYRSDRGRQLTQCFVDDLFDVHLREASQEPGMSGATDVPIVQKFFRDVWPRTHFFTMTRYASTIDCPIAFEPRPQHDGLGETVAKAGKTQLRMAETEKYPHVTYFFSGGIEQPWRGEERILVPSPKVATYDLQPEMNAPEVTAKMTEAIRSKKFDLIILNFANPDMVGHTGVLAAAITAVETVDWGLGEILRAIDEVGGAILVIADHGNCEQMVNYETGQPHTAHTTNPVPCILAGKDVEGVHLRSGGRLADIAPTLLGLMGLEQPPAMTGIDLRGEAADQLVAVGEQDLSEARVLIAALETAAAVTRESCRFYSLACMIAENQFAALGARTALREFSEENQAQLARLTSRVREISGEAPIELAEAQHEHELGDINRVAAGGKFNAALSLAEIMGAALGIESRAVDAFTRAVATAPRDDVRELYSQLQWEAEIRESELQQVIARLHESP